jgi:hypothetical protein
MTMSKIIQILSYDGGPCTDRILGLDNEGAVWESPDNKSWRLLIPPLPCFTQRVVDTGVLDHGVTPPVILNYGGTLGYELPPGVSPFGIVVTTNDLQAMCGTDRVSSPPSVAEEQGE